MSEAVEGEIVSQSQGVRLTKHDERIVQLLEAAFHNGFNITEACQYAEISRETYYEWLRDDDIFSYRMSVAQGMVSRKAKENVVTAIRQGDPNISLRYLTLRDPDFKPKATLETPEGQAKTEEKLKEFMDDTNDGAYPDTGTEDDGGEQPTTEAQSEIRGEVAQSPADIS